MASNGWLFLATMIVAYGMANLLQSVAAARTRLHQSLHPSLLIKLAGHRPYVFGLLFQFIGFILAFLARGELPLFLVQASVAAGLGVTAILGVIVLNWNLPRAEIVLLAGLVLGISGLVISAKPAPPHQLGVSGEIALAATLAAVAVAGAFAARLRGSPGSVALGSLAGLAFGGAAVASRPLTAVDNAGEFVTNPLFFLLLANGLAGQLLLGLAMQRGSTTAAVAAMDAANALPAAAVGLLVLGDEIQPGREWIAGVGFLVTLGSVIGLTRYAAPQHECIPAAVARHRRRIGEPAAAVPLSNGQPRHLAPRVAMPTNGARPAPRFDPHAPPNGHTFAHGHPPLNGNHGGHLQPAPLPVNPVTAPPYR